ncbi:MAG: metallophosphoesterase [candidate division KSB1 bacterium]|nr:metallophosphoesterase [candidate division KSB1 bacterium]
MKRLSVMLVLALGLNAAEHASFSFVFMTDIHVQPERKAGEGYLETIKTVNQISPDFVITGDDLIMDALGVRQSRADSLFTMYNDLTQQLGMPVFHTLGNHEVFGLYEKSGVSPQHPLYGKAMFRHVMGYDRTYHSFDYEGWHFICLDAVAYTPERRYYGHIDSLQLDWLKSDLAALEPGTPVVVFTHIPFLSVFTQIQQGATAGNDSGMVIVNSKPVLEVLNDYNVKLVLQGHLHVVESIQWKNTLFVTGGAVSARWWTGARAGFEEGFVVVDINGDELNWRYHELDWHVEPGLYSDD